MEVVGFTNGEEARLLSLDMGFTRTGLVLLSPLTLVTDTTERNEDRVAMGMNSL